MVTGGPSEGPLLADLRRQLVLPPGARVGFYPDFSLPELVAAVAEQDVLIASSTGPMHLAGVLSTPVVALFSRHPAHSPEKWRPLGEDHIILQPDLRPGEDPRIPAERGTEHMEGIAVEEVLSAINDRCRLTATRSGARVA
jgi:ADP-heptose:LPS heptosyltransferase